ncbi:MAG: BPSL0067 family protein [Pseudomonadota bacterium]
MSYHLKILEKDVLTEGQFVNAQGSTESVEFVRQAAGASPTSVWRPGAPILTSKMGVIRRGTAIATFDVKGRYPTGGRGKHAAIYLWHDDCGIRVLDQSNRQGHVAERTIRANRPDFPRVDCAKFYFVIE